MSTKPLKGYLTHRQTHRQWILLPVMQMYLGDRLDNSIKLGDNTIKIPELASFTNGDRPEVCPRFLSERLNPRDQLCRDFLSIPIHHISVIQEEQMVLDPREAPALTALDHQHVLRLIHI